MHLYETIGLPSIKEAAQVILAVGLSYALTCLLFLL